MENRDSIRVRLKEQSCVIKEGFYFLPAGLDEREVIAIVLDISIGGALLKTNIASRLDASFILQIPKTGNLKKISINSKIVRLTPSDDSKPFKPRYLMGLKFIDPDVKHVKEFIKLTSKSIKNTK